MGFGTFKLTKWMAVKHTLTILIRNQSVRGSIPRAGSIKSISYHGDGVSAGHSKVRLENLFNSPDLSFRNINIFRLGVFRKPRHAHDVAGDGDQKPGSSGDQNFPYRDRKVFRSAVNFWVVGEGGWRFCDTHRQVAVTQFFDGF